MELVSGKTLENERVVLDDKHFLDCTFNGCALEYSGQKLMIERTVFNDCSLTFRGDASRTLHFLQCLGYMPETESSWKRFSEHIN